MTISPGWARWRTRVRTAKNGDAVYFNVNRHLNLTNVCSASCAYCSFERKPGQKDAYTMRVEEAVEKALAMKDDGLTELHIVNGLHPTLPWKYYPRVLRELKAALPGVALKAFTATEVHWFETISGLSADEILDELIDAGLESLTGGGAEIFDWDVRKQIVDHNTHWEDWSRIHRLAHQKGLRTPATMLYGHIEEPRHRVDHVMRLRELQDETGGFQVFIPLRFHNDNNRLSHLPMAQPADVLRTFAVSRLMLDNFPHVKVFWVMHGLSTSQLALNWGADDMDGSVVEYKITHDADGFGTPDKLTRDDLLNADPRCRLHPGRAQHPLRSAAFLRSAGAAGRAARAAARDLGLNTPTYCGRHVRAPSTQRPELRELDGFAVGLHDPAVRDVLRAVGHPRPRRSRRTACRAHRAGALGAAVARPPCRAAGPRRSPGRGTRRGHQSRPTRPRQPLGSGQRRGPAARAVASPRPRAGRRHGSAVGSSSAGLR